MTEETKRMAGGRPKRVLARAIEERLAAYALGAGAGMLVLAQSATAQIMYTPTHRVLHDNAVAIDLNHDGQDDFKFRQSTSGFDGGKVLNAAELGPQARILLTGFQHRVFVAKLDSGSSIGGSRNSPWFIYGRLASEYAGFTSGPWKKAKGGYLGLRLVINGETHYGWARFTVADGVTAALLSGYAYNTVPNQPIKAGQTSAGIVPRDESGAAWQFGPAQGRGFGPDSPAATLGLLALGSPGLALWRRK